MTRLVFMLSAVGVFLDYCSVRDVRLPAGLKFGFAWLENHLPFAGNRLAQTERGWP